MKQLFFLLLVFITRPSFAAPIVKFDNDSVQIKVFLPKVKIQRVKDLTPTLIVNSTHSRFGNSERGTLVLCQQRAGLLFYRTAKKDERKICSRRGSG